MSIITLLKNDLLLQSDENLQITSQRFFKEPVKVYGIKSVDLQKTSKKYLTALKQYDKNQLFQWCEELWKSQYFEECIIACQLSESRKKEFTMEDFVIFEKWLMKYVTNWATCDILCNHTIGEFVMKFPHTIDYLKTWTQSDNRWVKRGAAVSLIIPARKGLFFTDIFAIAESLLLDSDDMVQKGYGWMLKAASQAFPQDVFDYVLSRKKIMPRTAYRYALEKMPQTWREEAMKR